jgi:flagellar basal body-associated protein FliL
MNKQSEDIKVIREMMEKSSKFQAINGLSLIIAGLLAVGGAAFAYFYLLRSPSLTNYNRIQEVLILLADAIVVLILAVSFISFFSWKKAKKNKQSLFNKVTMRAAYNLMIPLVVGGVFSLVLLYNGLIGYVASTTLIFYGLALVNASKFTVGEIHILGICEIIVGFLAAIYLYHGLYWWTVGFGVLHIIFGTIMYFKYDV